MLIDEPPHAIFGHIACFRNARHLKKRGRGRDVRVETAAVPWVARLKVYSGATRLR